MSGSDSADRIKVCGSAKHISQCTNRWIQTTRTHTHTHTHTRIHTHKQTHTYTHTHLYTHTYTLRYTHTLIRGQPPLNLVKKITEQTERSTHSAQRDVMDKSLSPKD